MFKTFKERIVLLFIIAIIPFFISKAMEYKKDYDRVSGNLTAVNMELQKFKEKELEDGTKIASQQQVILTQKEALANNLLEINDLKEYKKIQSKVSAEIITQIDTLFIPYDAPIDSLEVPLPDFKRTFQYVEKDDWFNLKGEVSNTGVNIMDLTVKNKYSILIADKRMGLFKKNEPSVVLQNENPYTNTIEMNNVQIHYKKPIYKKNGFWFGVGAVAGILIAK